MRPSLLIFILMSFLSVQSVPQIVCDATEWDFGKISGSSTLFHTFKLTNTSDSDFHIAGLSVSCSCVSAYTGRFDIKAGETIDMEVSLRPGAAPGRAEHYVVLYGPDEKKAQRFTLKFEQTTKQ